MHSRHSWHSWCTTSVGLRGIICNMFALWGLELKMYTQTNIRDSKSMTRNWREMACGRTCYGQYYSIFPFFRCLCIIEKSCMCLAWFLEFLLRLRVRSDGQVRLVDAPELADHIDPPLDVISLISNFSSFLRVDFVRWNSCLCILCMSHNGFLDARSLLAVSIAFTLMCLRGASFQSCAEVRANP